MEVVSDVPPGLTTAEANRRLARDGRNAVSDNPPDPVRMALGKLWAPVPWLLEAAIVLQLVLGEYATAAVVATLLIANAVLGYVQESRARTTLSMLEARLAPTASVRRDGSWETLPAAELVQGDLVTLALGTIVPADVRIVDGSVLLDTSSLTGESAPTEAGAGATALAGSIVRRGQAHGTVEATGARTRFGRGAELVRTAHVESAQQRATFRIVRNIALFNGGVTLLIVGFAVAFGMGVQQILPLVLVAVLAAVPVALPSMFTLAGTIGAREVSHHGVLLTRLSALDEAAGVDVLCADKTGTLTQNSLTVGALRVAPGVEEPTMLALAALASSESGADPVDAAVRAAAAARPPANAPQLVRFEPFDPARKLSSAVVEDAAGARTSVVKGAYSVVQASTGADDWSRAAAGELEASGNRVLAVASSPAGAERLVGLIAL